MILALLILLYFINSVCKAIDTNALFNPAYLTPSKIKQKFVPNIAVDSNRLVRNKTTASVI